MKPSGPGRVADESPMDGPTPTSEFWDPPTEPSPQMQQALLQEATKRASADPDNDRSDCVSLGPPIQTDQDGTNIFACAMFGETALTPAEGVRCCKDCHEYEPSDSKVVFVNKPLPKRWIQPRKTVPPLTDNPPSLDCKPAIRQIAVLGIPTRHGGADTELDHQIRIWQAMGIEVHLTPFSPLDENQKGMGLEARGCIMHDPLDWPSLKLMHGIAYCSAPCLQHLPDIRRHLKTFTWVNCMTWNFELEVQNQKDGLIDFHLYQTAHQVASVAPSLKATESKYPNPAYRPLRVTPYFHAPDFPFHEDRDPNYFSFGRLSRQDEKKFHPAHTRIYDGIESPVPKRALVQGWDFKIEEKCGEQPIWVQTEPSGSVSQQDFYKFADCVVMATDNLENLPRVGMEAMASGSVLIVENRGGWQLEVEHDITGFLCDTPDQFIEYGSRMAKHSKLRHQMAREGRDRLDDLYGAYASARTWMGIFKEIASL